MHLSYNNRQQRDKPVMREQYMSGKCIISWKRLQPQFLDNVIFDFLVIIYFIGK